MQLSSSAVAGREIARASVDDCVASSKCPYHMKSYILHSPTHFSLPVEHRLLSIHPSIRSPLLSMYTFIYNIYSKRLIKIKDKSHTSAFCALVSPVSLVCLPLASRPRSRPNVRACTHASWILVLCSGPLRWQQSTVTSLVFIQLHASSAVHVSTHRQTHIFFPFLCPNQQRQTLGKKLNVKSRSWFFRLKDNEPTFKIIEGHCQL